jgi:hypothetical protein
MTPSKAARQRCLQCAGSKADIRRCPFADCSLWPYRIGARATLKAIRSYCLSCCKGQASEVRLCPAEMCPLHRYRFGHNPARIGQGGQKSPLEKSLTQRPKTGIEYDSTGVSA